MSESTWILKFALIFFAVFAVFGMLAGDDLDTLVGGDAFVLPSQQPLCEVEQDELMINVESDLDWNEFTSSSDNVEIVDGVLRLEAGETSGSWVSSGFQFERDAVFERIVVDAPYASADESGFVEVFVSQEQSDGIVVNSTGLNEGEVFVEYRTALFLQQTAQVSIALSRLDSTDPSPEISMVEVYGTEQVGVFSTGRCYVQTMIGLGGIILSVDFDDDSTFHIILRVIMVLLALFVMIELGKVLSQIVGNLMPGA